MEGVVVDNPDIYPDKTILIVRMVRLKQDAAYHSVSGNIRLVIPADLNFRYGDYIRFSASLKKIVSFHNPGGFDYERYLNMKNIFASAYIYNKSQIILLRKDKANHLRSKLEDYRLYLQELLNQFSSSPQKEVIEAMTLGNKRGISTELRDSFNKTGTSHLLAISGLHIGMVFMTGFFLFSFLLKRSEFLLLKYNVVKLAAAGSFFFVLIYASIAGMGITVMRATLMALVFLIAFLWGRQRDIYNSLALAGIVILILYPAALFDISFQLSFCAVFSIIYIVPRLNQISFSFIDSWPLFIRIIIKKIYLLIIVCIAASVGTMPLIVFYFGRISAITVIANLFAVILLGTISLALSMGFIFAAIFSSTISGVFIKTASFFVKISLDIIDKLASLPWSSFAISKPGLLEISIFYVFIFILIQIFDEHFKKDKSVSLTRKPVILKSLAVLCLLFFIGNGFYLFTKERFSTNLRLTAIDVGQGSATLIRFPKGGNMLIDGGGITSGSFDIGKMVIAPFLHSQRISTIHTVVLTHPHPDHLQGLLYITDNFNVKEVWSTGQRANDELYLQWEKIISDKKIKTKIINAQSPPMEINGVSFNVLWPPDRPSYDATIFNYKKVNDDSLVFKINYGQISFLLPADISSDIERVLIDSEHNLVSDVLFVPHHGSHHSSSNDFIKATSCRYAIVSSGKNNIFRHPHKYVLKRFQDSQVKIYRTDESGAITMSTNGTNLYIDTFKKNR
ncbi:MAG: DNA internalization-related competence protein ComEC/Rec2 [Syntrophaceae bacterium]|nr:DNA internalization-related competence protein ComEC/Rec2 [Syntrophaceae bacterium]